MVPGKIAHLEQLYPSIWYPGIDQEQPRGIRLLGKAEAESHRQQRAEVRAARTYVDAFRCDACGHVELFATRHLDPP